MPIELQTLVEQLRARGVTIRLDGTNIRLSPITSLTLDEAEYLRRHLDALSRLLADERPSCEARLSSPSSEDGGAGRPEPEKSLRGSPRLHDPERAEPSGQASVSRSPGLAEAPTSPPSNPEPPDDDPWFELRGWPPKRIPITRFDPAKVDEFLTLVRRNALRRDDE